MATSIAVSVSNPGVPVQIVAPPPALVDDGLGGGFGGGQVTTILETVGPEVGGGQGSEPPEPEPVPSGP